MIESFFRGFFSMEMQMFSIKNLLWHLVAIGLTALCVLSGFDWWFFEHTRSDALYYLIMTAGIGGFFVPVILPLILYIYGEFRKKRNVMDIGIAIAQAGAIAYLLTVIYKTFTGRVEPEFLTHFSNVDRSMIFHFGFLQYGVFWGWPSSHAAVACAGSTVLARLSSSRSIKVIAILWGVIVAIGAGVGFHWFSDALAGTIFGILTGTIVARSYTKTKGA